MDFLQWANGLKGLNCENDAEFLIRMHSDTYEAVSFNFMENRVCALGKKWSIAHNVFKANKYCHFCMLPCKLSKPGVMGNLQYNNQVT